MQQSEFVLEKRIRWVFGVALAILGYRFFTNTLLSQISTPAPPLVYPSIDNTYWLLLLSGIPQFLMSNSFLLTLFDITLLGLPILIFIYKEKRLLYILFTAFIMLYYLLFNLYCGHHFHSLVGLILISIPFWTKNKERFVLLWDAVRYYTLFVFASAALWKIARGSAFDYNHLHNVLQLQHAQYLFENPSSIRAGFIKYLLSNPDICFGLLLAAVITQSAFIIGFFTKRADSVLLILMGSFVIVNYAVMNIVSTELMVLGLTLLPDNFWSAEKSNAV